MALSEALPAGSGGLFGAPVFVLCHGRSGSTLLRFLLDAHPELACPPETNLPGLCVQLATVWSLIEGAPLLARVYPQARFVCMYRHPMDVIASGVEACP